MTVENVKQTAQIMTETWKNDSRWRGIKRNYSAEEVLRLRPSVLIRHTLAEVGCARLWELLQEKSRFALSEPSPEIRPSNK